MILDSSEDIRDASQCLQSLSHGIDGEALIGQHPDGSLFELKVLQWSMDDPRLADLQHRLGCLKLVTHPSVRHLVAPISLEPSPQFSLAVPADIDSESHLLANLIEGVDCVTRLAIAAQVVDATTAAHRVGLYHGSFSPSTMLVGPASRETRVYIDFTGVACRAGVAAGKFSVDDDLIHLHRFLQTLLAPLLESCDESSWIEFIEERNRSRLVRYLTSEWDSAPMVGQWWSILQPMIAENQTDEATGELAASPAGVSPSDESLTDESLTGESLSDEMLTNEMTAEVTNIQEMKSLSAPELDVAHYAIAENVPEQIGRFKPIAKVGEGGMGTVYRAIDMANQETIALKVLRSQGKDIVQAVQRFRKEARMLADAQNEHVTRLIEIGEDGGIHYLAMEFVEGVDFRRWLKRRKIISESDALRVAADLARALVEAHSRDVIHRDIKPENVLLKLREDAPPSDEPLINRNLEDLVVKLTDFGIARHVNQSESLAVTRQGALLGTPRYMSPEQCKAKGQVGPASDVYSIGISLFEMLAGSVPFDASEAIKITAMHCMDPVPSIQKRNNEVSDQAARLIERMLAKRPEDRFGDASQLLAEIQRVMHGEITEIDAHPKLPPHDPNKLWKKTVSWDLQSAPDELWEFVSNTERLNEAIGLPPVDYRTEKDPDLGIRKFGTFTLSGVKISWEEHPFEWIEGRQMGILREFSSGPFKWFMSIVTLSALPGGGTKLSHEVRIEPRNLLGRVLTTVEADWKGFRNLTRVYERMDRCLQGRLTPSEGSDAYGEIKPLHVQQDKRIRQRIDRVIEEGVDPAIAGGLGAALKTWSAQELAQMRPLDLAARLGFDGKATIDACLYAAKHGLLRMHWEIICPTCRAAATKKENLSLVDSHVHCEACDVDFKSNLGNSIEMVFQAHPEIRAVNEGQYCIGGPEHSPHVVAQVRLEAGERIVLTLDLGNGDYQIRGPRLPKAQSIRVQDSACPSVLDLELSSLGGGSNTPRLRGGRQQIEIFNDLECLHVVRVERMIPRGNVVTATAASANPVFRRLFPGQHFSAENPIESETMSFLATQINNSDEIYSTFGDVKAYELIRKHLETIRSTVEPSGGTVVKSAEERTLSVFNHREDALNAAFRIRDEFRQPGNKVVDLGIVVHSGPTLVTTQNQQLDYFGATVRNALSLTERAAGDLLVSEPVYTDAGARELMPAEAKVVERIELAGSGEQRVKRIGREM